MLSSQWYTLSNYKHKRPIVFVHFKSQASPNIQSGSVCLAPEAFGGPSIDENTPNSAIASFGFNLLNTRGVLAAEQDKNAPNSASASLEFNLFTTRGIFERVGPKCTRVSLATQL